MKTLQQLPINGYQLEFLQVPSTGEILINVRLERRVSPKRLESWAICDAGDELNKDGKWEFPLMPSSRDEEFYKRCRWNSAEEAFAFWQTNKCESVRAENARRFMAEHPELFPPSEPEPKVLRIYEIINPSDPYTLKTDDFEVAAIANSLLGEGKYGLKEVWPRTDDESDRLEMPMFFISGHDAWCQQQFGGTFSEVIAKVHDQKREALAQCLESVLVGTLEERLQYERELEGIRDGDLKQQYKWGYMNSHRSSTNDIGHKAAMYATLIRSME